MKDPKNFLASLPHAPGVYQMLNEKEEVLYVGKARDLKKRVTSYFAHKTLDIKTSTLLKHVEKIDITVTQTENEALLLESQLIKKIKPHYNVLFRDDKSYPYLIITISDPFPRVDLYRGSKKPGVLYFGPYPHASGLRETIKLIQKLFKLRGCNDHYFSGRARPCIQHQIGRCTAPCVDLISESEYRKNVEHAVLFLQGKSEVVIQELSEQMEKASQNLQYESAAKIRDQITKLRQVQEQQYVSREQGDVDVIGYAMNAGICCLQLLIIRGGRILGSRSYFPSVPKGIQIEEIISSFIAQHYLADRDPAKIPREFVTNVKLNDQSWLTQTLGEIVGHKIAITQNVRLERKKWLEMAMNTAKQSLASHLFQKINMTERFVALQKSLHLEHHPKKIECFDVSHTMGEEIVASCVVFDINGPVKSNYRRFNITGITPGDDVSAMKQVLQRRYKKAKDDLTLLPDLILIDGGKGQLNAAQAILKSLHLDTHRLIGVAKGLGRKPGLETLHRIGLQPLHLAPDSEALLLIQQIRDEAHRFAITGHRLRRDKKRRTSTLETIPGIGSVKRRELLRYFGGIQAIERASMDEIAKVPGISYSLAERIYAAFRG